jgi:hypothetical protein
MREISDPGRIRSNELSEIARRAFGEFNDLADYIWKSPRFIENVSVRVWPYRHWRLRGRRSSCERFD